MEPLNCGHHFVHCRGSICGQNSRTSSMYLFFDTDPTNLVEGHDCETASFEGDTSELWTC